jgi:hypothetical protein
MINLLIKSKKTNKVMKKILLNNITEVETFKKHIKFDKNKFYFDVEEKFN